MDWIAKYLIPALIGAVSGLGGAVLGAWATLRNGERQRRHDLTLEQQRLADSRASARREIEARLREFAGHVARYREFGTGELAAMQSTFDRLNRLMESDTGGPAALPSDQIAEDVYAMLEKTRS